MRERLRLKAAMLLAVIVLTGCAMLSQQRAQSELEIYTEIAYIPGSGNSRHLLDLYLPRNARQAPVLVFVHGGYWNFQDKDYLRPLTGLYANVGIALARRGIAVAVTDYRIAPDVGIEDELMDTARAIAWVQKQIWRYGGDSRQMVLSGHSAGGHMITLLGLEQSRLRASGVKTEYIRGLVPLSPILDIQQMQQSKGDWFNWTTTYPIFGQRSENYLRYSPRQFFRADMPPLQLIYGGRDEPYLLEQSKTAAQELQALGASGQVKILGELSHEDIVLSIGQELDPVTDALELFVKTVVTD